MQTIRKIKRKDLDVEKYAHALNQSQNYRIYAESWYLDVLTNSKWECWVYGDYEAIMPIPLQYKFGIKFVLQPIFCQQLGVFYKDEISSELFREFEGKLHKYRVRSYHFNEENTEKFRPKGENRINYLLDLNQPYEDIKSNYSKSRRKDLSKSERLGIKIVEANNPDEFLRISYKFYKELVPIHQKYLVKLLRELQNREKIMNFNVVDEKGDIIASQLFLDSELRKICLGFARNKDLEKHNSSAFAKDYLVQKLTESNSYLDFEGSMIKGVAEFFEGFGATKMNYTVFKNFKY